MLLQRPSSGSLAAVLVIIVSSGPVRAGGIPDILIWQPPHMTVGSGDALLADLTALGEDAALDDDLFAYSADLSGHEIVIGVVGITPDTHVIDAIEGATLDAYVQNGGLLYLEGADCFNYDPEQQGGYNVRPIFGLELGSDGNSLFNGEVVGIGPIAEFGFDFDYFGEPSFLDELAPVTSTAILRKKSNEDILGVFHAPYGDGRAIAATFEYAGLFDFPSASVEELAMRQSLLAACLRMLRTGVATAVGDVAVAPAFTLHPAAPNPFRHGTTIRYEIPKAARAQLAVFDVAGRRVRTLVGSPEGQGLYSAHWDGRDGAGKRVASGVYFFSLDVRGHALQRKVVVVK